MWYCFRNNTNCANNHSTAWCLFGGHKWNVGRIGHSSGICASLVRNIDASRVHVHFHMLLPSRHTSILCLMVSLSPHMEQWIRSPDRPVRSQSLYWLSYPAHRKYKYIVLWQQKKVGWGHVRCLHSDAGPLDIIRFDSATSCLLVRCQSSCWTLRIPGWTNSSLLEGWCNFKCNECPFYGLVLVCVFGFARNLNTMEEASQNPLIWQHARYLHDLPVRCVLHAQRGRFSEQHVVSEHDDDMFKM
jgi:hypothetical protein